jgi:putative ATPase
MKNNKHTPLADRMRPDKLDDFLGQDDVLGVGKMLRSAIETDRLPSMIFWGPPGSGKTTLAFIIAKLTKSEFLRISAVTSGLKDLRTVVNEARANKIEDKQTILFIDEIHRWNKKQQDALLPHVEDGTIVLIGATTENPSFEIRGALLSRCRVFVLKRLEENHIKDIIVRAINDTENGLGNQDMKIDEDGIAVLASLSNGDARIALNILEYASSSGTQITIDSIKEAFQKSHLLYDKNGEEHYNIISALHKSMRGSDADAALYWLARMIEAGEEPLYIARRLVRFASEDIGLANSRALEQAVAAYQACHFLGLPECNVVLAQAVVYMSKCQKSNSLYTAYKKAAQDVRDYGNLGVPMHIRNAPTKLMAELGYGKNYKYSPDHNYLEKQAYFPDKIKKRKYL